MLGIDWINYSNNNDSTTTTTSSSDKRCLVSASLDTSVYFHDVERQSRVIIGSHSNSESVHITTSDNDVVQGASCVRRYDSINRHLCY